MHCPNRRPGACKKPPSGDGRGRKRSAGQEATRNASHPHLPVNTVGVSTLPANAGGLLGLHRAGPSAPLDERVLLQLRRNLEYLIQNVNIAFRRPREGERVVVFRVLADCQDIF